VLDAQKFIDALYMLTSTSKQRFEFIFTDFSNNPAHFSSIFEIYKIYQSTSLYRELKLRGAILTDGQLNILPQEQVFKQLSGIYNLSSDQVRHTLSHEAFSLSLSLLELMK
jgi:Bardet-Biedl syndrome 5 protein